MHDDPLVFWKLVFILGVYPSLEQAAKKHLTRSAASVPDGSLFRSLEYCSMESALHTELLADFQNEHYFSHERLTILVVCFEVTL